MRFDILVAGININYSIYLYFGNNEVIQLYGYSYGKHFQEVENFLNGLVSLKKSKQTRIGLFFYKLKFVTIR